MRYKHYELSSRKIFTVSSVVLSKLWCLHQLDVKNVFLHKILMKSSTCTSPTDSTILNPWTMGVCSRGLCMDLNKHYPHDIIDSVIMSLRLYSLTTFLITHYLFITMAITRHISLCMWVILSLLLHLTRFVSILCPSWILNLQWNISIHWIFFRYIFCKTFSRHFLSHKRSMHKRLLCWCKP